MAHKPIVKLNDSDVDVVWDDALWQTTFTEQTTGIYGDGFAFLYDVGPPETEVLAYDVHAGLASYNNNYWNTYPLGDLHVTAGLMVAPSVDQNGNYGFAAFPGKALALTKTANFCRTAQVLSNAVDTSEGVAFIAGDGKIYSISFYVDPTQTIQSYQNWSLPLGDEARDTASLDYGSGQKMLACLGASAVLCDLSSPTGPTAAPAILLPGAPVQIASSGAAWYVVLNAPKGGYNLYSYPWTATSSKQRNWTFNISDTPGKPVPYNARVYFADAGGKFTAVDAQTGSYSWSVDLGGDCSNAKIAIEDGVAYLINAGGTLFAIDLSSESSPNVVQKAMGSGTAFLGVENGVCTVTYMDQNQQRHLAAIDMAGEVYGFSCESTLLPDGMSGAPGSSIPSSPVYHTFVQLLDTNKNPRAYCSVKISSYEQVTLADGSASQITLPSGEVVSTATTYTVTATTPVWLTTDASGVLNLTLQAQDLSCPSLYLWATFMDRDEAIVIYPDNGSTQKLQSASSSELSSATTFDGSPMLSGNTDTPALSSAIGQAIGSGVPASMALARTRQADLGGKYAATMSKAQKLNGRKRVLGAAGNPDTYLSFPATTTNMLYQYPASSEATRPYNPASSSSFTVSFGGAGGITYSAGPPENTLEAASDLGIADFKAKIVHGANAIRHMACTVDKNLKQAIHTIVSDAGDTFSFVVQTLEDAVTVVAGMLKTLVNDIEKAIEWLCALFDWKAILANKDMLKNLVITSFQDFGNRINQLTKTGCADVHSFFSSVKSDLQKALGNATSNLQGSTIQSRQVDNNDPKTVFTNNSLGPANHFNSKLKNNVSQSQTGGSVSASLGSSFMSGEFANLKAVVESALATCEASLKKDLQNILQDLDNFIKSFRLLVADPSAFVKTSFTEILQLFVLDIVETIIDAADAIVETVLGIVVVMLEGLLAAATASISIPVVSPLWKAITGDPLSFIDVICLLGAVPYTIIQKATQASESEHLGSVAGQTTAWEIFTCFSSMFDAGCDGDPDNSPDSALSIFDLVFDSLVFGLSYPSGESLSATGGAYWACQCTPIVMNLANTVLAATGSEVAEAYNSALPNLLSAFGCVNAPGATYMAFTEPDVYLGKDDLTLVCNLLGNLVLVGKPGVNSGPAGRFGVATLDFALPATSVMLTVVGSS
jgi:PQQ-like domain